MRTLGLVFPGQGSQAVGMLAALYDAYPVVGQTFAEASAVLGFDLWALTQTGPEATLNQTANTQPALLAAGVAVWRVWRECGGAAPLLLAGHSLGEYSALVCAGALTFAEAVALVAVRARLMQEAVPLGQGAMAALLGLDAAQVQAVCAEAAAGAVVAAANFNAPGQIVIAGTQAAIARALPLAKAAGAKRVIPLPVSVPSHCALMRPAAEQLAAHLARMSLQLPQWPVLHNATVTPGADPIAIRALLTQQLYCPVRWVETVQAFATAGINTLIEMGPGQVLTGLIKRIDKTVQAVSVNDPQSLQHALEVIHAA